MARDNVTFKFRIDLSQMTVEARKAVDLLNKLDRASDKASVAVDRLGKSSQDTGRKTAAAAVNFQTATQGALNLSTAIVQTYTSISNLDRANNRAKMSVIAVARAEDLLANKIERQNTLRIAGAAGSQKYLNITKEIATATADLTVKEEKMRIEQAAVNDIYMLFATNIANVTISSMQTLAILDKNNVMVTKAKVVAQKIYNLSMFNGVRASLATQQATAIETAMRANSVTAINAQAGAVARLTVATKAFMASNPLLLVALAASVAAFAIHESNILGTKTALDDLMGVEKSHLDIMQDERDSVDSLTGSYDSLSSSIKKLNPVHKAYLEMMRDATLNTGDYKLAAQYQAQLLGGPSQGFSSPSLAGGQVGTGGGSGSGGGSGYGGGYGSGGSVVTGPSPVAQAAQNYTPSSELTGVNFNPGSFKTVRLDANGNVIKEDIPLSPLEAIRKQQIVDGIEYKLVNGKWVRTVTKEKEKQADYSIPYITDADTAYYSSVLKQLGIEAEAKKEYSHEPFGKNFKWVDLKRMGFTQTSTEKSLTEAELVAKAKINPDPFGNKVQKALFYGLTPPQQQSVLQQLAIDTGNNGTAGGPSKGLAEKYALMANGLDFMAESYSDPTKSKMLDDNGNLILDPKVGFFNSGRPTVLQDELHLTKKDIEGLTTNQIRSMIQKNRKNIQLPGQETIYGDTDRTNAGLAYYFDSRFGGSVNLNLNPFTHTAVFKGGYGGIGGEIIARAKANLNRNLSLSGFDYSGTDINALFESGGINTSSMVGPKNEFGTIGTQNIVTRDRTEGSTIEELRKLQIKSILESITPGLGTDNAFKKSRVMHDFRSMVDGVDATLTPMEQREQAMNLMNQGTNSSDMSRFRGQVRRSQSIEILKRNATTLADNKARNQMKDDNTNRLNLMGGTRVEGIPMDEAGAVVGGYSSRREFDQVMKQRSAIADRANQQLGAFFGVGINYAAIYGKSSARSQQSQLNSKVEGIRSSLASAGLGYKTTNARYTRGQGPAQFAAVMAEWANVKSFNANQLSKANEINTLQQGFGLTGYSGSSLSLPSLQDAVAKQDELIKTIGLNRTEAFQIIDTAGRGRDEIDARVLWKNRVNNISTGTSVL